MICISAIATSIFLFYNYYFENKILTYTKKNYLKNPKEVNKRILEHIMKLDEKISRTSNTRKHKAKEIIINKRMKYLKLNNLIYELEKEYGYSDFSI